LRETTYGFPVETLVRSAHEGARVREVDVHYRVRRGGQSKVAGSLTASLRAGSRMLTLPLRLRRGAP
jgi:hypothetical protein